MVSTVNTTEEREEKTPMKHNNGKKEEEGKHKHVNVLKSSHRPISERASASSIHHLFTTVSTFQISLYKKTGSFTEYHGFSAERIRLEKGIHPTATIRSNTAGDSFKNYLELILDQVYIIVGCLERL